MADTMKGLKRTHYCGTVTPEMIGREVVVCGWAQKTRDMGTLVFIDLRDRTGIVQLAFDDKTDPALLAKAQKVRGDIGGDCRQRFLVPAGIGQQAAQQRTEQHGNAAG